MANSKTDSYAIAASLRQTPARTGGGGFSEVIQGASKEAPIVTAIRGAGAMSDELAMC